MRPALAETQRYLWRLITAPDGVDAGLAAMRDEDPALAARLEALVAGDERLSAARRVDVYANMYFFRLLDSLKEDFPAVFAVLGDSGFHNLITDYLLAHPSSHPSLRFAGRHLPSYLRRHASAGERPWLADLAALEWALLDAFDAADTPVLAAADLQSLRPEEWSAVGFTPSPSVRLLELEWSADDIWERAQRGETAGEAVHGATAVQVWRRDLRVFHRRIEPLERDCLALLLAGEPFGAWCERAAEFAGDEGAAAAEVVAILRRWLAEGALAALERPAP